MTAPYLGPDAMPLRTIAFPFADDPDWLDPAVDEPDDGTFSTLNIRRGSGAPLRAMSVSFAFLDTAGAQLVGGTADLTVIAFKPAAAFDLKADSKMMRENIGEWAGADLSEPHDFDVTKYAKVAIRLTNITAPGAAVELRLSIQEIDP